MWKRLECDVVSNGRISIKSLLFFLTLSHSKSHEPFFQTYRMISRFDIHM